MAQKISQFGIFYRFIELLLFSQVSRFGNALFVQIVTVFRFHYQLGVKFCAIQSPEISTTCAPFILYSLVSRHLKILRYINVG